VFARAHSSANCTLDPRETRLQDGARREVVADHGAEAPPTGRNDRQIDDPVDDVCRRVVSEEAELADPSICAERELGPA
jgi:hypothetical protein